MVLSAITLHLIWAFLLIRTDPAVHPNVLDINAIHSISQWPMTLLVGSPTALAVLLAGVAVLALAGLLTRTPWVVILLAPQQVLLTFSAAGAISSAWLGHFGDGALYPSSFILADQMYSIVIAVFHTCAIFAHSRRIISQ